MITKPYYRIASLAIKGYLCGLIIIITVAFLNYHGFKGPIFHLFSYLPLDVTILLSPVYLGIIMGFIGCIKRRSITLNYVGKVISQVNEAIIITNIKGVVQWVNEGFINMYGYTHKELKGKNITDILHGPLTDKEVANYMIAKLRKGDAVNEDLLVYHKNGEPMWISASIKPSFDKIGNVDGYIAINKHIGISKAKDLSIDALNKEIADYKYALDQSSGVVIFDLEGKILTANNIFCTQNNLINCKIVGRNLSSINCSMANYSIAKPIWNLLNEGLTWKGELITRSANNDDHWADTTIVPLLNDMGNPYNFLLIEKNITERKLLESKLENKSYKLQMALEIGSIGFWEIDLNNDITLSEDLRKIIKEPLNSPIDLAYLFERISPDDVVMIQNNLIKTRTTFQRNDMEFQFNVHGDLHYLATSNTAQFNKEGDFVGLFGTMQDVTAVRLTELALQKSEEEKARAMQIAKIGTWEIEIDGVLKLSDELKTILKEPLNSTLNLADIFERMCPKEVEMIQNCFATTSTTFQKTEMEYQYIVEGEMHYFTSTCIAQFNKLGDYTGLFGTVQDITAFKLIELALKKSEEEKATAMQIAKVGTWEMDINGVLLLSDELKILMHEPTDANIDLSYAFDRMLPEEFAIMQNKMTLTSTTFQKTEMDYQFLIHGNIHYFKSICSAQFDYKGEFTGLFGTVQDITAFTLMELAFKKSEEEKQLILNNLQAVI